MRVSGGELRGRTLRVADDVRPTTGRVREAVFSILAGVDGDAVLDLFCGSGAMAIEALSRGAASAVLVDTEPAVAERNVAELGLEERASVIRGDAAGFLASEQGKFDLIVLDPPYTLADRFADELDPLIPDRLAPGGRVIAESSPEAPLELALALRTERRYGDSLVRVYEIEEPS